MKTLTKIGLTGLLVASLGIGVVQAIPPVPRMAPVARVRGPIAHRPFVAPRASYWGPRYYPGVSVDFYDPGYAYYDPGYVPAPAPGVAVEFGYTPGPYYYGPTYYPYGYTAPVPRFQAFPPAHFRANVSRGYRATPFRGATIPRTSVTRRLPHR